MKTGGNAAQAHSARSKARRFALQALYQMQLTGASAADVEAQFRQDYDMKRVDIAYLHDLLTGIAVDRNALTTTFAAHLDREVSELDAIANAALLIGTFELVHRIDIPYRVVIDESVELAKQFGGEDSHRLINSVLDALTKEHRQLELKAGR